MTVSCPQFGLWGQSPGQVPPVVSSRVVIFGQGPTEGGHIGPAETLEQFSFQPICQGHELRMSGTPFRVSRNSRLRPSFGSARWCNSPLATKSVWRG